MRSSGQSRAGLGWKLAQTWLPLIGQLAPGQAGLSDGQLEPEATITRNDASDDFWIGLTHKADCTGLDCNGIAEWDRGRGLFNVTGWNPPQLAWLENFDAGFECVTLRSGDYALIDIQCDSKKDVICEFECPSGRNLEFCDYVATQNDKDWINGLSLQNFTQLQVILFSVTYAVRNAKKLSFN